MNIPALINSNKMQEAKAEIYKKLNVKKAIVEEDIKKWVGAEDFDENFMELDEARFKYVKVRIRKGKIQRRKKVAAEKGYTIRGGKVIRMNAQEKRNRRISQKRGAIKRRAKKATTRLSSKKSMRKAKIAGVFRNNK